MNKLNKFGFCALTLCAAIITVTLTACGDDKVSATAPENQDQISSSSAAVNNIQSSSVETELSSSSSEDKIGEPTPSSISTVENSSYIPYTGNKPNWKFLNPSISYGEIVDERDGQRYKTVVIGNQTWLAENLNLATVGGNADDQIASKCAKDSCEIYGRLYTWAAAMNLDATYNNRIFHEIKEFPIRGSALVDGIYQN